MKFLLGLLGSTALVAGGTIPLVVMNPSTTQANIVDGHLFAKIKIKDDERGKASSSVTTNGKNESESNYEIEWDAEQLGIDFKQWRKIDWKNSTVMVDGHASFKDGEDFSDEVEENLFVDPVNIKQAYFEKSGVDYVDDSNIENSRKVTHYAELALDINFDGITLRARTTTKLSGDTSAEGEAKTVSTTMIIRTLIFDFVFKA